MFVFIEVNATHIMGGEITWECIKDPADPNVGSYIFTMKVYRDCDGVTLSTFSQTIDVWDHPSVTQITVDWVSSSDISPNCDVANKIGTYGLAVLAKEHNVPFYVVAPVSTLDLSIETGEHIPIEHRHGDEVRRVMNNLITKIDVPVYNPSFDVTPYEFVNAIISEKGVARPPFSKMLWSWKNNGALA